MLSEQQNKYIVNKLGINDEEFQVSAEKKYGLKVLMPLMDVIKYTPIETTFLDCITAGQNLKFCELKYEIHKWNQTVKEASRMSRNIANGPIRAVIYQILNQILIEVINCTNPTIQKLYIDHVHHWYHVTMVSKQNKSNIKNLAQKTQEIMKYFAEIKKEYEIQHRRALSIQPFKHNQFNDDEITSAFLKSSYPQGLSKATVIKNHMLMKKRQDNAQFEVPPDPKLIRAQSHQHLLYNNKRNNNNDNTNADAKGQLSSKLLYSDNDPHSQTSLNWTQLSFSQNRRNIIALPPHQRLALATEIQKHSPSSQAFLRVDNRWLFQRNSELRQVREDEEMARFMKQWAISKGVVVSDGTRKNESNKFSGQFRECAFSVGQEGLLKMREDILDGKLQMNDSKDEMSMQEGDKEQQGVIESSPNTRDQQANMNMGSSGFSNMKQSGMNLNMAFSSTMGGGFNRKSVMQQNLDFQLNKAIRLQQKQPIMNFGITATDKFDPNSVQEREKHIMEQNSDLLNDKLFIKHTIGLTQVNEELIDQIQKDREEEKKEQEEQMRQSKLSKKQKQDKIQIPGMELSDASSEDVANLDDLKQEENEQKLLKTPDPKQQTQNRFDSTQFGSNSTMAGTTGFKSMPTKNTYNLKSATQLQLQRAQSLDKKQMSMTGAFINRRSMKFDDSTVVDFGKTSEFSYNSNLPKVAAKEGPMGMISSEVTKKKILNTILNNVKIRHNDIIMVRNKAKEVSPMEKSEGQQTNIQQVKAPENNENLNLNAQQSDIAFKEIQKSQSLTSSQWKSQAQKQQASNSTQFSRFKINQNEVAKNRSQQRMLNKMLEQKFVTECNPFSATVQSLSNMQIDNAKQDVSIPNLSIYSQTNGFIQNIADKIQSENQFVYKVNSNQQQLDEIKTIKRKLAEQRLDVNNKILGFGLVTPAGLEVHQLNKLTRQGSRLMENVFDIVKKNKGGGGKKKKK